MSLTRVQPNSVNKTANFAFANVTANYLFGNGYYLSGVSGGGSNYANSNVAAYLPTYTGNVSANYFIGNGSLLTNITGGNVTGQVANALIAGTVYTSDQPNITSVGTLSSLTITANGNITLSGSLSQLTGANLVSATYVSGTLTTASQPNITTVGTLSSLSVTGNISAGNANITGTLTTSSITTSGSSGNISGVNYITANYFSGNGSLLTSIAGANVTGYVPNATNANTVTTAAQPNITSTGTLSSLTVSGLITATGTGIKTANIQDSSGTITITTKYNNNTGDVGVYGNIVAGTNGTGNVTATYYIGNGSQLTGITVSTAGTVTTNAQPNITSTGTLTSLSVSGYANFTNTTTFKSSQDVTISGTPSGTVNYDLYNGMLFDVSPTANWTANVANIPTTNNRSTVVVFVITQGATPYVPNVFQISGSTQTVKWLNNSTPGGTANKIDVISYSMIRSSGGTWTVLGQSATYG